MEPPDRLENITLTLENDRVFYVSFLSKMRTYGVANTLPIYGQGSSVFRNYINNKVKGDFNIQLSMGDRNLLMEYFYKRYHQEVFGTEFQEPIPKPYDIPPLDGATAHPCPEVFLNPTPKKEKIDMTKLIENKTFVKGADAAKMSDEEIFTAIAEVEAEVNKLSEVKTQSKKLQSRIDQLKDQAAKLAEYVDNR